MIDFTGYLLIWSCAGGGNKVGHRNGSILVHKFCNKKKKKKILAIHYLPNQEHNFCSFVSFPGKMQAPQPNWSITSHLNSTSITLQKTVPWKHAKHTGESPVLGSEEQPFTKISPSEPHPLSHARCIQSKSIHQMGKIANCPVESSHQLAGSYHRANKKQSQ